MSDETLDEQVEDLFPLDGPYNDERTRAAARSIAALVRYLNHAGWSANAYPWPSTVDSVVGSLGGAVAGLEQTLEQLSRWFGELCARDDAYSTGSALPPALAAVVGEHLTATTGQLDGAQRSLSLARSSTTRVGIDEQQAKRQRGEA